MRSWENDGSFSDLGTERGTGCRRMRDCLHLGVNAFGIHIPRFLSVESLLLQRSSFFGVERTFPPHERRQEMVQFIPCPSACCLWCGVEASFLAAQYSIINLTAN